MSDSEFERLYQKNLKILRKRPISTHEPHNPGPSLAQFVEAVAGMGERIQERGTVINRFRPKK